MLRGLDRGAQASLEAGVRTSLGQSSGLHDYSPHDECFFGSESFENLIKAMIPPYPKNTHGYILPNISGDKGPLETLSHLLSPHGPCMSYLHLTDTRCPWGRQIAPERGFGGGPRAHVTGYVSQSRHSGWDPWPSSWSSPPLGFLGLLRQRETP